MFEFWYEFKHLCKCVIFVPYGGTIRMLKAKWVTQSKPTFDLKVGKDNFSYNLKLDEAIMGKKNNPILYYKLNNADPLTINPNVVGKDSTLYHTVLKNKEASDILNEGNQKNIYIIIGLFVIAIIAVGLYSQYQLGIANDKILTLTKTVMQMYANSTKAVIVR